MAAPVRKPGGLGLQPHQPWTLHARLRSAFSLALRVLIDAERTGIPCRPDSRRGMALTSASRCSRRSADGQILPGPTLRHTGPAPAKESWLTHKIQPPSAARPFLL